MAQEPPPSFWSLPKDELLRQLDSSPQGLTQDEAHARLELYQAFALKPRGRATGWSLLLSQYKSPIILLLLFAAGLSFYLRDHVDALIIMAIVLVSGVLTFWQERGAVHAVARLLSLVQIKARVRRQGEEMEVPVEEVVPGDLVLLSTGDVIPGDCLILESRDLFVDEATLTGETFPVEKEAGLSPANAPLPRRTNILFMGTHVVSGTAVALVVLTGAATEFGQVSETLKLKPPETEFERGVRRFGYFLMEVTLLLVMAIFAINVYLHRPALESFMFSLALAVGAKLMAREKVIVKRLAAIENFGSMNVLCADKTGTLTRGEATIHAALDVDGHEQEKVLFYAYLNAYYETGFANPIDQALRRHYHPDLSGWRKLDEVPYDFLRRRLSILVEKEGERVMITKGALSHVLAVCTRAETAAGEPVDLGQVQGKIQRWFAVFSQQGLRVLGIAYRRLESETRITRDHEIAMTFLGFLLIEDPPKPGIAATISKLQDLGVTLKIITGDNALVAASLARKVGLAHPRVLTGHQMHRLSDEALVNRVGQTHIFAEVEPNQKERIILALRKAGHVVGFLGDGINDASALHAADVSLSVDQAVDVAKEAADIVLLEKDLGVLVQGVQAGRTTFANTLKYVFMATSANFGNMFSMAGASLFLAFLPLLPKQILLTNLLTDLPEMTIATDRVDMELTARPRRWDIRFIRKFMITFGLISSVFDYLTFGALLWILKAGVDQFRTGWFQESVIFAAVIVLVIRTRKPFLMSRPSRPLLWATLAVVAGTLTFPYTPLAVFFNFQPLPLEFVMMIGLILVLYISAAEIGKHIFYRRIRS
jgi:Mg2+-importing ATPase